MSVILAWLTACGGFGAFAIAGVALFRSIRNTTKSDRDHQYERNELRVASAVAEATARERQICKDRVDRILAEKRAIEEDRNHERGRADTLQTLINERGLGSAR